MMSRILHSSGARRASVASGTNVSTSVGATVVVNVEVVDVDVDVADVVDPVDGGVVSVVDSVSDDEHAPAMNSETTRATTARFFTIRP